MSGSFGLEGVIVTTSKISSIIDGVLSYRGYNIDDLFFKSSFEEVIYLLFYGLLPSKEDFEKFKKLLYKEFFLLDGFLDFLKRLPLKTSFMSGLRTIFSYLGNCDSEEDDINFLSLQEKIAGIYAKIVSSVTSYFRIRKGLEVLKPKEDLNFTANFLTMLGLAYDDVAVFILDKIFILHADHELNASTFAARVTASTLTDVYSSLVSALATLKGTIHGGANEQVMNLLEEIKTVDRVEEVISLKLKNKEKIAGFGHRVYKDGNDPRVKHLKNMVYELAKHKNDFFYYDMLLAIEKEVYRKKGLKPNIDFYTAAIYSYLGIPKCLFTPFFAVSRAVGWLAHILEQYSNNRLIRPRAEYIGPTNLTYLPFTQR